MSAITPVLTRTPAGGGCAGATFEATIARQMHRRRVGPWHLGLKINLYRDFEVDALADAAAACGFGASTPIESVMVADSYFMTHMGRSTTRLESPEEQSWGLDVMVDLVAEVRAAVDRRFRRESRPYVVGDLPDGATSNARAALRAAERFARAGADAVKVEVTSELVVDQVERLRSAGFHVMAHVGYTPQDGAIRRHGDDLREAQAIFAIARRLRDAGASSLVLEMVSEDVNRALSTSTCDGLPIYSVFSGRAVCGGQSLNVWDAVLLPRTRRRYFPPTAEHETCDRARAYTRNAISRKLIELIDLTLAGKFPLSPPTRLTPEERAAILSVDPWAHTGA